MDRIKINIQIVKLVVQIIRKDLDANKIKNMP